MDYNVLGRPLCRPLMQQGETLDASTLASVIKLLSLIRPDQYHLSGLDSFQTSSRHPFEWSSNPVQDHQDHLVLRPDYSHPQGRSKALILWSGRNKISRRFCTKYEVLRPGECKQASLTRGYSGLGKLCPHSTRARSRSPRSFGQRTPPTTRPWSRTNTTARATCPTKGPAHPSKLRYSGPHRGQGEPAKFE